MSIGQSAETKRVKSKKLFFTWKLDIELKLHITTPLSLRPGGRLRIEIEEVAIVYSSYILSRMLLGRTRNSSRAH